MGGQETYLLVGGSGSLGTVLTQSLLDQGHKVRTYSRGEHGIEELEAGIPRDQHSRLSCIMGAVEDLAALERAASGVDFVLHVAAQKIIHKAEYNPIACVQTNVLGTANVVEACRRQRVKRAVFVSSDKACASVNLYGHTKAVGEKLWIHGNRYRPMEQCFVGVRYGNCWNSKGSVLEAFQKQAQYGHLEITDPESTRFHWRIEDAARFVLETLKDASPGEIWIPKLPSYRLQDLADAFAAVAGIRNPHVIIGLRPGEKKHESMISEEESFMARKEDTRYVMTPDKPQGQGGWGVHSGATTWRIGRADLQALIQETLYAI